MQLTKQICAAQAMICQMLKEYCKGRVEVPHWRWRANRTRRHLAQLPTPLCNVVSFSYMHGVIPEKCNVVVHNFSSPSADPGFVVSLSLSKSAIFTQCTQTPEHAQCCTAGERNSPKNYLPKPQFIHRLRQVQWYLDSRVYLPKVWLYN